MNIWEEYLFDFSGNTIGELYLIGDFMHFDSFEWPTDVQRRNAVYISWRLDGIRISLIRQTASEQSRTEFAPVAPRRESRIAWGAGSHDRAIRALSVELENSPHVDYGKPASVQCRRAVLRMNLTS